LNLYEVGELKAFLGRHGLSAAKGLGQHFLVSKSVVEKIVRALDACQGVLEIGPGPGVLTRPISEQSTRMIAIELDERMIAALGESAPKADVRKIDALEADLTTLLQELPEPRGLVSNLPYYITGPLLTRIAEARQGFSVAVLMMQKEVGERVLAKARESARGSLSVYLQSQFDIDRVASAPAGAFLPPPKVDSVVLRFIPKPLPVRPDEEARFFKLVRSSFAQPRKTLANNLLAMGLSRDEATATVARAGLGEKARPQELTLEEWVAVLRALP
jgi:16S rRNA (adenine1518-N6/adenine1519-N6)-dimethyltransferase